MGRSTWRAHDTQSDHRDALDAASGVCMKARPTAPLSLYTQRRCDAVSSTFQPAPKAPPTARQKWLTGPSGRCWYRCGTC